MTRQRSETKAEMIATPRTDAIITGGTIGQITLLKHAQSLERESDMQLRRIENLQAIIHNMEMAMPEYEECCALREKAERDK